MNRNLLLLDYQKAEREVQRILQGPIPVESDCRMVYDSTLQEAQVTRNRAAEACIAAGIDPFRS